MTRIVLLGLATAGLASCAVDDLIEIEIIEEIEQDHWVRNGERTCMYRYKILNNTADPLIRLNISLTWQDRLGRDIDSPVILNSVLPPDTATSRGQTPVMQGRCDQIVFKGISNVLRCQVGEVKGPACINKLRTRFNLRNIKSDPNSDEMPE